MEILTCVPSASSAIIHFETNEHEPYSADFYSVSIIIILILEFQGVYVALIFVYAYYPSYLRVSYFRLIKISFGKFYDL